MNSPYLIIDRSGNAVDINSTEPPTCHDQPDSVALETDFNPFKSCNGCPSTRRHPGCHDTCLGKAYRKAIKELERKQVQLRQAAYSKPSDAEFERRNRRVKEHMLKVKLSANEETCRTSSPTRSTENSPPIVGLGCPRTK